MKENIRFARECGADFLQGQGNPPLGGKAWGRRRRIATASVRTGFAMTHCMKCGTSPGGRPQGSPLRSVTRSAMGGPMWASAPTERLLMVPGAGGVEPRPYGEVARGAGKESPSHGFAVPAPFRQGGQLRTREADCHSRCAHRLRNDMFFFMGRGANPGGRTGYWWCGGER